MSKDQQPPAHPDEDLLHHLISAVKPFFLKNGLHILLTVAVIVLVIVLFKLYGFRAQTRVVEGWEVVATTPDPFMLASYPEREAQALRAAGIDQCRAILDEGSDTTATPWLLLKVAGLYGSGREWDGARKAYQRVLAEHEDSPAADMARAGLARVLEETGQYTEAAAQYEALASGGRPGYLLGAARCMELAGDAKEAGDHYRALLAMEDISQLTEGLGRSGLERVRSGRLLPPPPPKPKPEPVALPGGSPLLIPADTETAAGQFAVPAQTPAGQ